MAIRFVEFYYVLKDVFVTKNHDILVEKLEYYGICWLAYHWS